MIEHMVRDGVTSLDQLRGRDGQFFTGTVNVLGGVNLYGLGLNRIPVRFGAVGGNFICNYMQLTSLEGVPHSIEKHFSCSCNRLTSLEGVHRILRRVGRTLDLSWNLIETGGIGLILVEGLTGIITNQPALKIIEQHLGQGNRGLLRCQEALHEAGYGEFARV